MFTLAVSYLGQKSSTRVLATAYKQKLGQSSNSWWCHPHPPGSLNISGRFPVDMRMPPPNIKMMLESNPLKSRILVHRLAAIVGKRKHLKQRNIFEMGMEKKYCLVHIWNTGCWNDSITRTWTLRSKLPSQTCSWAVSPLWPLRILSSSLNEWDVCRTLSGLGKSTTPRQRLRSSIALRS